MRIIILVFALFLLSIPVFGQNSQRPVTGPGFYFNSFQDYKSKNVDSSIHYAKLLAANNKYNSFLQDLLHNNFAQSFRKFPDNEITDSIVKSELSKLVNISKEILNRMIKDTLQSLVIAAKPIYYWTQAQLYEKNADKLRGIANNFIRTQLRTSDIYTNKVDWYALLIY